MSGKMMIYKLVVLGDGGVGKTALTIQLCLNHFVETYDPTIEDSYRKQTVIDGQPCMLEVLDTAGQEEYTALRDQWIREGEGFLLVYSIAARATFERVERFRAQISRVKDQEPSTVPIMLVGNKCDKVNEREVSREEGQALANRLGCKFVESSAKTCVNVEKAYFTVVRQIREQRGETIKANTKSKKSKKCNIL
ncbi:small G-protein Ras2 [Tilletiaria anomala UBC 951]|uniref:Small G-protein Ras2 n=1 Tax=Tilletiaria anomala (strain ATCC 24038 / CBS 436.72 / UBC 951) TaxID=1037660 RepID=A0A066WLZ6_TILAU|nr:small G-protein Ras2 [Tilletiaria anomala UBC 951]KDN53623.1 small G-protein Ras2 [Tilletiaria anomala UBC 951]